jgi:peptidoglycan/LPS O-acetylase OafA/YrhL
MKLALFAIGSYVLLFVVSACLAFGSIHSDWDFTAMWSMSLLATFMLTFGFFFGSFVKGKYPAAGWSAALGVACSIVLLIVFSSMGGDGEPNRIRGLLSLLAPSTIGVVVTLLYWKVHG